MDVTHGNSGPEPKYKEKLNKLENYIKRNYNTCRMALILHYINEKIWLDNMFPFLEEDVLFVVVGTTTSTKWNLIAMQWDNLVTKFHGSI